MPLQINGLGKFRLYSAPRRQALSDTRAKGSRRRPPHTKSRGGCHSCKESRVKCDEARPKCQRLLTRQKSCIYDRSGPVDLMQHGLLDCSISPIVSSSLVECGYGPDSYRTCKRMQDSSGITPGAHLTQNFVHCIDTSFASEAGRVIAKRFLLSGCVATLMLMHALLALSARSIQHHQPMDWSHEVAFRYHSQETSGLLNTAIQQGVDAHNIDLNTILQSWVFKDDEASGSESSIWYMIQEGMRYLSYVLKQHFNQTFWRLKYDFGDLQPRMLFCAISGASASERRSPKSSILADVCQVTAQSTPENNVYYFPLELLSHLLELTRNGLSSLDTALAFSPRVSHLYRMLVQEKGEQALLLFMLWLRLLSVSRGMLVGDCAGKK